MEYRKTNENKTAKVEIRVTPKEKDALKALAKAKGCSLSDLIVTVLQQKEML